MKQEKELRVKDIVRKIGEVAGLIDVCVFDNDIVRSYLDPNITLNEKAEFAVLGILAKYQDELLANKKQYEKNPEMKKVAYTKVKTIESFILEYRGIHYGKYRINPHFFSFEKSNYLEYEENVKIVCEKFEKMYATEIKDYKSKREKEVMQKQKEVYDRKTLLKENLKNL